MTSPEGDLAAAGMRPAALHVRLRVLAPGLGGAVAVALAARAIGSVLPDTIADITIALLLGLIVAHVAGGPARAPGRVLEPGVSAAAQQVLRIGIVLLGARLSLDQIAAIGLPAALVIALAVGAAFLVVLVAGRAAGVDPRLGALLAVGTAICGNSAIVATAPIVGARAREIGYAVATITLFGTAAVFVYPVVGRVIGMSDAAFGLWAGIAINDTSQVIAASSAHSSTALEVATVVKLIRNALMLPLLVLIAWRWHATRLGDRGADGVGGPTTGAVRRAVPVFVVGFVVMAGLRTVGVIDDSAANVLDVAARSLILVALAGVGLSIRVADFRETDRRPLLVGLVAAASVGTVAFTAIVGLGLG